MSITEDLKVEIIKSLIEEPCSQDDLRDRPFMENKSMYAMDMFITQLKRLKVIFVRGNQLHVYKHLHKEYK